MNVGIDIGGTKTLIAGFDKNGKLISERKFSSSGTSQAFIKRLLAELAELGSKPINKIVVGAPGAIDKSKGIVMRAKNLNWQRVDLASALRDHAKEVVLENDAKLAGIAEARVGAGRGYKLVLYVTISTGIGTAIVQGGHLVLPHSEGGQMILNSLPQKRFEELASGKAIKKEFGLFGYQIKDPKTWSLYASGLAIGLYNLITTIKPDVAVLGGGVAVHYPKFIRPLEAELQRLHDGLYQLPPVRQAKFTETAVIEGCRELIMGKGE